MSDAIHILQKKIKTAHALKSIIKTLKILAAINIGTYEKSVAALHHYYQTVQMGLVICLMQSPHLFQALERKEELIKRTGVVIFGSDQGMVGQFNELLAEHARIELKQLSTKKIIWTVGERIHSRMLGIPGIELKAPFNVPNSITSISLLINQILDQFEGERRAAEIDQLLIFYNKPKTKAYYDPTRLNLLPIDKEWLQNIMVKWPTNMFPEAVDGVEITFSALIREHLFTSIFRACVESMASENASRLAAMEFAEKKIEDLLEELHLTYNLERKNAIDAELFDVVSGFEAIISTQS